MGGCVWWGGGGGLSDLNNKPGFTSCPCLRNLHSSVLRLHLDCMRQSVPQKLLLSKAVCCSQLWQSQQVLPVAGPAHSHPLAAIVCRNDCCIADQIVAICCRQLTEADFELLADVLQHYPRDYKDFQAVPSPGQNATLYGRVITSEAHTGWQTYWVDTIVEVDKPAPLQEGSHDTLSSPGPDQLTEPGMPPASHAAGTAGTSTAEVNLEDILQPSGCASHPEPAEALLQEPAHADDAGQAEVEDRAQSHAQASSAAPGIGKLGCDVHVALVTGLVPMCCNTLLIPVALEYPEGMVPMSRTSMAVAGSPASEWASAS